MSSQNKTLLIVLISLITALPLFAAEPVATPVADPQPLPYIEGSWTFVLFPDTQVYTMKYPDILTKQITWILDNKKSRNIAFAATEGDITNNNTKPEWENAQKSFNLMDGVMNYALVAGNHDYGNGSSGSANTRDSMITEYFPVELFTKQSTFGGFFDRTKSDNSYHLFSAGGRDWLVIALEWAPRDRVVQWANAVLDKYPNRSAMIITHAYLYSDDTRYDHTAAKQSWNPHNYPTAKLPGSVNDGEELWQKLIYNHRNVAFVFCGHVLNDGTGLLTSKGVNGNEVHQILANYQIRKEGGEGYLRLVEFLPDGKRVQIKTYSPHLDKYLTASDQQFVLDLPPAPAKAK